MTLEDRYRRRLRLFPKGWRAENEEEVLGILLESASASQRAVGVRDTIDLFMAATRIRLRGLRSSAETRTVVLVAFVGLLAVGLAFTVLRTDGTISPEYLATSLIVVLIPGTGVVYTVSSAIGGGWQRGSVAAAGCTLGIVPHMLAAMLGLSGVMQAGAAAFEVVRWIGVAYLVFMGVSMIRSGGGLKLGDDADAVDRRPVAIVRRGILLNLLNPKLTVFFFAFLPQFLTSEPRILDLRLLLLGAVFMAITFVAFIGYAFAGASLRARVLESPAVLRWVRRALGTLLVGFAARLAVTDR